MSNIKWYCNATWSLLSALVTAGLVSFLLYSALLQSPPLSVTTEGLRTSYTVSRGSPVFLENPTYPPTQGNRIQVVAKLTNVDGAGSYRLARVDTSTGFIPKVAEEGFAYVRPGYPVYSVFIPSYVKPGVYIYQAEASYRLNMFRMASFTLPELTITVE